MTVRAMALSELSTYGLVRSLAEGQLAYQRRCWSGQLGAQRELDPELLPCWPKFPFCLCGVWAVLPTVVSR